MLHAHPNATATAPLVSIPFGPADSMEEQFTKLADCANRIEGTLRPIPASVTEALIDGTLSVLTQALTADHGAGNGDLLDAIVAWQEARGRF